MIHSFLVALAFILVTGLSAFADTVSYNDGDISLRGFLVKADSEEKSLPGVIILPAWKGIDAHSRDSAEKLSKLGYVSLVADIYGVGGKPLELQQAMELSGYYKEHYQDYQKRIRLAIEEIIRQGADPNRLAIVGYCFGGTGALEAARGQLPVRGVISVHGGLAKDANRPNEKIATKVLILHGADDPHVSEESIQAMMQELREGNADWQMIWYADAVHSFSDPDAGNDKSKGAAYNPVAARRSWEHMELFLKDLFAERQ